MAITFVPYIEFFFFINFNFCFIIIILYFFLGGGACFPVFPDPIDSSFKGLMGNKNVLKRKYIE